MSHAGAGDDDAWLVELLDAAEDLEPLPVEDGERLERDLFEVMDGWPQVPIRR